MSNPQEERYLAELVIKISQTLDTVDGALRGLSSATEPIPTWAAETDEDRICAFALDYSQNPSNQNRQRLIAHLKQLGLRT